MHYGPYPIVRNCLAVYPALFFSHRRDSVNDFLVGLSIDQPISMSLYSCLARCFLSCPLLSVGPAKIAGSGPGLLIENPTIRAVLISLNVCTFLKTLNK